MKIQRIRRQSQYEDWPSCQFCDEPTESGYQFWMDGETICICDPCLAMARQSRTGWICNDTEEEKRVQS